MGRYQTEQKKMLLSFFASHPTEQFSAEQAANALLGSDENEKTPGKSTVYRLVLEMARDGYLRRFSKSDGGRGWVYQYHEKHDCDGHLHLKCSDCGALLHLECGMSSELLKHIESMHQFRVNNSASILYGLCGNCHSQREMNGENENK